MKRRWRLILCILKARHVRTKDVLVIRDQWSDQPEHEYEQDSMFLRDVALLTDTLVISMLPDRSIESLDERDMREHGWVRARRVEESLDHTWADDGEGNHHCGRCGTPLPA